MSQYAAFVAVVAADSESPVAQLIGLRSLQVGKPNVWTMVVAAMEASIICLVGAIMMQMEKVLRGGNGVSGPQKARLTHNRVRFGLFCRWYEAPEIHVRCRG